MEKIALLSGIFRYATPPPPQTIMATRLPIALMLQCHEKKSKRAPQWFVKAIHGKASGSR